MTGARDVDRPEAAVSRHGGGDHQGGAALVPTDLEHARWRHRAHEAEQVRRLADVHRDDALVERRAREEAGEVLEGQ